MDTQMKKIYGKNSIYKFSIFIEYLFFQLYEKYRILFIKNI